jgi:RNA polymerase sigma-70 factor (ECF subfamily)
MFCLALSMNDTELEQLYDTQACGLFHYFVSLTRSESDARDLLQEMFIKLAASRMDQVTNEKAWLWRMAHNLALDWWRRHRTRQDYEQRAEREQLKRFQEVADPDAGDLARWMNAAVSALPEEQRTVLQLKLFEDLTFEQVAEVQGIPLNTAASRYRYALDKIRTVLRPIYEELR